MLIHLIADYGTNDPAFAEVTQQLLRHLPSANVYPLSVPPFSTLAIGFWVAQLGLNASPLPRLIYHNPHSARQNVSLEKKKKLWPISPKLSQNTQDERKFSI